MPSAWRPGPRVWGVTLLQLIPRQGRNIRGGVQESEKVFPLGLTCSLAEVLYRHHCADLLCGGGREQLVHSHTFLGSEIVKLSGETVGYLNRHGAHVFLLIIFRKFDGVTTDTPHLSAPRKSRRLCVTI